MVTVAMSSAMSSPAERPDQSGVVVTHPNRDKPVVQATRATVILLLLISAGLIFIVTVAGWNVLQSAVVVQIAYIIVYLTFAFYAARWNRGVLPVAAVLAVILGIFSMLAGPGWFDRDKLRVRLAGPPEMPEPDRDTHAADPARADTARHVCHARLLPGLERRAQRRDPAANADAYADAPPQPA